MTFPYFNLLRTVWKNGQPWHVHIIGYYLAYIIAQGLLSLSPYAFGRTIDLLQHFSPQNLHAIIFWLSFGVLLYPLFWLFHGPARVVERKVALKIQQSFMLHLYQKLTQLSLKWHQDHHSGDSITRINRACRSLNQFAEGQFNYIEIFIKFLVSIGFLLWISPLIGFLCFLTCMLAAWIVIFYDRLLVKLYAKKNSAENHIGSGLFDYISNMTTVLTLRLAAFTEQNILKRMSAIWPPFKKEVVLNETKWFIMNMTITVIQSLILIGYILYQLKAANGILIGTVVMIFRYQWDLTDVFFSLSIHYSELVKMNTDVLSVQPILKDIEMYSHPVPSEKTTQTWQTIAIQNLNYHHLSDQEKQTLEDIEFVFKRGEKIALIGASGAGKSTLLNLLSGLYSPDKVQLTIDDRIFHSLEPLHAITTLIPQEPELFENTIAFNITMDIETSHDTLQKVLNLSEFAPILEKLSNGLATDIREKGLNLSVGQKQRLALARGLFAARFSSLILMDEPTSSVDLPTEKKILSSIINEFPSATVIVSLHRLHLLPKFTRIIMLDEGKIIANGPTETLLSEDGPVKTLWNKYHKNKH